MMEDHRQPPPGRRRHLFTRLDAIARRAEAEMRSRLDGELGVDVRGSITRLLVHLSEAPSRPTELARAIGMTKQAVGERIQVMTDRGWAFVAPDPADGRSILVHITPAGARALQVIDEAIEAMEDTLEREVGPERYAIFVQVIDALGAEDD